MAFLISFIRSGRTGNNIFQYITCKLISHLHNNNYKYIPIQNMSAIDRINSFIVNETNIRDCLYNPPNDFFEKNIICDGYFQHSDLFVPHIDVLKKILYDKTNDDYWIKNNTINTREYISHFLYSKHKLEDLNENDIVISLRLDDFIQLPAPRSDIIPPEWYLNILENWKKFNRLFIVCDRIRHEWEFNYIRFFDKWNPIIIQDDLLHDCALMREAPVLIHSNSTLCWIMSFFSLNENKQRFIPKTLFYGGQSLDCIGKNDSLQIVNTLSHNDVYTLNYRSFLLTNIHPLSYCIPDECVESIICEKTKLFSSVIPGDRNNYKYNHTEESLYYQQYAESYFGHTKKKGGWDCLRHYEIIANKCIPIFENIEYCPSGTLTNFPKSIVSKSIQELLPWKNENVDKYNYYAGELIKHVKTYCTTSATANYFLNVLKSHGLNSPKRVLLLRCDEGVNYTRELLWIGLKRLIMEQSDDDGIAVEFPRMDFLYDSITEESKQQLYGNGFTYSGRIKEDNIRFTEEEIVKKIDEKYWDLIIYGKVGPDENIQGSHPHMPYWNRVFKKYNKNQIAFLYGGDECFNMEIQNRYYHHLMDNAKYGICFVRELMNLS